MICTSVCARYRRVLFSGRIWYPLDVAGPRLRNLLLSGYCVRVCVCMGIEAKVEKGGGAVALIMLACLRTLVSPRPFVWHFVRMSFVVED